jgi:hypothetical protein
MNQKELEAYNVGKFGLPGDNEARLWPTQGEYLAWQRGRRERLEAEAREGKVPESRSPQGYEFETTGEHVRAWSGRFGMLIGVVALIPGYGTAIEQNMRFPDLLFPVVGFGVGGFLLGFLMTRLSYAIIRGAASIFLRHRLHEPRLGLLWVREGLIFGIVGLIYGAFKPIGAGIVLGISSLVVFGAVGVVLGTCVPLFFRVIIDWISGTARRSDRSKHNRICDLARRPSSAWFPTVNKKNGKDHAHND